MNVYTLWQDDTFSVSTPKNPHIPYSQGLCVIVMPNQEVSNAWENVDMTAATFKLSAKVCKIIEKLHLAPWFNIQANGNWGLLPSAKPFFHVYKCYS